MVVVVLAMWCPQRKTARDECLGTQVEKSSPEEDQELSGVAVQMPEKKKKQTRQVVAHRTDEKCLGGMVFGTDHVVEE